jgi:Pyridoxamine 5'-phosphate oxidase
MGQPLDVVAPAFVEMAHRIVWCVVATTDAAGSPTTRVLHPVWEWDGERLSGWIATSPLSPKAKDLAAHPFVALTYWSPNHDTCTARADAVWETSDAERAAGWDRFVNAAAPVGYDPSIVPGWEAPTSPGFGILRLSPRSLRVMPGTVMLAGTGELLTWKAG